ncbi:hypothetical protein CTM88_19505 [Photobacterium aquimaris]|uniref:Uncharacterized protein n=1 Tax=Photobacterium aquimaris TaxID=512643 RepID=A0A2T3IF02_9GAMM|nr:hypothetical protein [Photobacterium aquimaris]OBU19274.1 hypothetical protein AYY20_04765 [Photobacterium aquimaris]PSU24001.1 hypothetical protein CTM88_19505 [Photobacterium aquimaris]
MSLEQQIGALVKASENLTGAVNGKIGEIDKKVEVAESEFEKWRANFSETINGIEVYKQGGIRRFFFGGTFNNGGYTSTGGPDSNFPTCSSPQAPSFLNILEFVANSGFGSQGDIFKIEYISSHRGMGASDGYTDHFIFTGTSFSDSVAGQVEFKKISASNHIKIFISEPNNEEKEVDITKDMQGSTISVSFRTIGQGYDAGKARVTLKVDTRYHCGAGRAFGVDVTYTSNRGQPCKNRLSMTKPQWDLS